MKTIFLLFITLLFTSSCDSEKIGFRDLKDMTIEDVKKLSHKKFSQEDINLIEEETKRLKESYRKLEDPISKLISKITSSFDSLKKTAVSITREKDEFSWDKFTQNSLKPNIFNKYFDIIDNNNSKTLITPINDYIKNKINTNKQLKNNPKITEQIKLINSQIEEITKLQEEYFFLKEKYTILQDKTIQYMFSK